LALSPLYLVDKSALEQRRHDAGARTLLTALAAESAMATCHIVAMEVLYSARNKADYLALLDDIRSLRWLPVTEGVMDRALDVQRRLALRGQHRLPLPDLMIAATAEIHGATVLHYDRDYDLIAAVTGQPARWIVPRGAGG